MNLHPFNTGDLAMLEALADCLQSDAEERTRALARQLHDDLGSYLVAATMDIAWLTRHQGSGEKVTARLHRVDNALTKAIELTRRLVDELQPALIDTVGLFAAVSAHFVRESRQHRIEYSETMLGSPPDLGPDAMLVVFRIAQGLLRWIREDAGAKQLFVIFEGDVDRLTMRFVAEGLRPGGELLATTTAASLAPIEWLARKLRGTVKSEAGEDALTIQVQIPAPSAVSANRGATEGPAATDGAERCR